MPPGRWRKLLGFAAPPQLEETSRHQNPHPPWPRGRHPADLSCSEASMPSSGRKMALRRPLSIAVLVTGLVAVLAYVLPNQWQSTGVGLCLLIATHRLV